MGRGDVQDLDDDTPGVGRAVFVSGFLFVCSASVVVVLEDTVRC